MGLRETGSGGESHPAEDSSCPDSHKEEPQPWSADLKNVFGEYRHELGIGPCAKAYHSQDYEQGEKNGRVPGDGETFDDILSKRLSFLRLDSLGDTNHKNGHKNNEVAQHVEEEAAGGSDDWNQCPGDSGPKKDGSIEHQLVKASGV